MGFGNDLFGVDMAGIIADTFDGELLAATLHKNVVTGPDPSDLTGPPLTTSNDFTAQGFVETYSDGKVDGTIIKRSDRKITLIGDLIEDGQVPEPNDEITIEGVRRKIVGEVDRDPDKATYTCQSR